MEQSQQQTLQASTTEQQQLFLLEMLMQLKQNLKSFHLQVMLKTQLGLQQLQLKPLKNLSIKQAFAAVTMAAMKEFKLPHDKVNVFGGGISLGHPIGTSGTRIVVTLMNAMKKKKAKLGLATLCIGGGEALSLIIERIK
jgi:acetyl-CoA C-acetyltransferase